MKQVVLDEDTFSTVAWNGRFHIKNETADEREKVLAVEAKKVWIALINRMCCTCIAAKKMKLFIKADGGVSSK